MALAYVENMPAVIYHGITVYHTYKNNLISESPREFWFTLAPYGEDDSEDSFDIREMESYSSQKTTAANLLQMIDASLFGETNLIEREASRIDDTYAAEDTQVGICPVCHASIEDCGTFEVHDTQIEYPFTCKNCGVSGSEWGEIVFDGFSIP